MQYIAAKPIPFKELERFVAKAGDLSIGENSDSWEPGGGIEIARTDGSGAVQGIGMPGKAIGEFEVFPEDRVGGKKIIEELRQGLGEILSAKEYKQASAQKRAQINSAHEVYWRRLDKPTKAKKQTKARLTR